MTQLPNPFIPANVSPELANPFVSVGEPPADDNRFALDEDAFFAALTELAADRAPAFIKDPSADYLATVEALRESFAAEPLFAPIFELLRAA